jgi:hypothetical protein
MGPKETAVRNGLAARPANIINTATINANSCFAGFFNGALSEGSLHHNGSLFIGKAECEWNWRTIWVELRKLGLIDWTTEQRPNHPSFGGHTTYVLLTITAKGWEVRNDDNMYFAELMKAMDEDEKATLASNRE